MIWLLHPFLGIKDKEALRDLFVKIGIVSRSPTPNSDTQVGTQLNRLKTRVKDLLATEEGDARVHKEKYVHEWLAVYDKPTAADENAVLSPGFEVGKLTTHSRKIKLASPIVSKIKLYKVC